MKCRGQGRIIIGLKYPIIIMTFHDMSYNFSRNVEKKYPILASAS